jgi:hypothetical protein
MWTTNKSVFILIFLIVHSYSTETNHGTFKIQPGLTIPGSKDNQGCFPDVFIDDTTVQTTKTWAQQCEKEYLEFGSAVQCIVEKVKIALPTKDYVGVRNKCNGSNEKVFDAKYFLDNKFGDCRVYAFMLGIAISNMTQNKYTDFDVENVYYIYAEVPQIWLDDPDDLFFCRN